MCFFAKNPNPDMVIFHKVKNVAAYETPRATQSGTNGRRMNEQFNRYSVGEVLLYGSV